MTSASIVVYHNKYDQLRTVVNCAFENNVDKVYVIDHSSDDSLSKIKIDYPQVEYIHRENTGYGGGHNVAIRESIKANFDYHAVINPDVIFYENTISTLVKYLDENPRVGLITPKIVNMDGSTRHTCHILPVPYNYFWRFFYFGKAKEKKRNDFELRYANYETIMKVPFVSGCFMMFRLSALKDVGLFDENIFLYCEDSDISRRVASKYDNIMLPSASAIHFANFESHRNPKLMLAHIKSLIYYYNKWGWFKDKERKKLNEEALMFVKDMASTLNNK